MRGNATQRRRGVAEPPARECVYAPGAITRRRPSTFKRLPPAITPAAVPLLKERRPGGEASRLLSDVASLPSPKSRRRWGRRQVRHLCCEVGARGHTRDNSILLAHAQCGGAA